MLKNFILIVFLLFELSVSGQNVDKSVRLNAYGAFITDVKSLYAGAAVFEAYNYFFHDYIGANYTRLNDNIQRMSAQNVFVYHFGEKYSANFRAGGAFTSAVTALTETTTPYNYLWYDSLSGYTFTVYDTSLSRNASTTKQNYFYGALGGRINFGHFEPGVTALFLYQKNIYDITNYDKSSRFLAPQDSSGITNIRTNQFQISGQCKLFKGHKFSGDVNAGVLFRKPKRSAQKFEYFVEGEARYRPLLSLTLALNAMVGYTNHYYTFIDGGSLNLINSPLIASAGFKANYQPIRYIEVFGKFEAQFYDKTTLTSAIIAPFITIGIKVLIKRI